MAKLSRLPKFAADLLAACPSSGTGVHQWLFKCAGALQRAGCGEEEAAALIAKAAAGCGRELEPHEIPDAIKNSKGATTTSTPNSPAAKAAPPASKWPKPKLQLIESIENEPGAPGLVDLAERSPVRFEDDRSRTEEIIDRLYPGNPLLCCGLRKNHAGTGTREEWRGKLAGLPLIVPNPMTAEEGRRKTDGKLSTRTLDNTGPRRFLVVEFDDKRGEDSQAARLWHLSRFSPLVMAVHSGGKSVHGWFCTHGDTEADWLKFMRYAVSLGADPATWTRCQLVRMPDGTRREAGAAPRRQAVHYFDPEALPC
ncbi:MAG: hypothetical protein IAE97_06885 [Chthoniobacterales bacterium]|nr:hypothetical protein [Chthoniobacterales bacterium]